ncbi:MAG: lysine--tRNA ligase [Nitrospinota bacterium]|nr:lysine--tRNA ligase [Nitrospinota bacterium]
MSYKEWPYIEAQRIADRAARLGKESMTAQTGYGPSGLPHIGTFGEVARTSFVLQALEVIAPQLKSHLISFSDDMDGLREAPQNIPNREMVLQHLGKPLTSVPDPYGEEASFAHNMNRKLREFLDSFGFKYEFASSTDKYRSGAFNEGLKRIMGKYDKIKQMFVANIAEDKRDAWSPFFPICQNCGRVYTTVVTGYDAAAATVAYSCQAGAEGKYDACGHKGVASVLDGNCKVGWKVDWALRWAALGIDYEMHGEDLLDSARLSSKIVREIGGKPPELFKYELFLDEEGRKISKKIGNGVTMEQWLRYAPVDSLLYFMYLKPQQTKKMGLPLLPKIVDGYLELMAGYDGHTHDSAAFFVGRLAKGVHAGAQQGENIITYSLIDNLASALSVTDPSIVREYLIKYQPAVAENLPYYEELIADVLTYYTEWRLANRVMVEPTHEFDEAVAAFAAELEKLAAAGEVTAEAAQNASFQAAKERGINMKQWFGALYGILLGQDSGPRIGSFVALIGVVRAVARLKAHLEAKS